MKKVLSRLRGAAQYGRVSFSQEGEDLLLARIFNDGRPGTYVDVGAHHPFRFSNTYLFYKLGWRGINIDAAPGSMTKFNQYRRGDTNLETGVSLAPEALRFFSFAEPALNTFSASLAESRARTGHAIIQESVVTCAPLSAILRDCKYAAIGGNSFLSVDVEGLDLDVLRSNDWSSYRPSFIVAEILGKNLEEVTRSPITTYLREQGYRPYSKLSASVIFKSEDYTVLL